MPGSSHPPPVRVLRQSGDLAELGVGLEVGPGTVLAGFIKRIQKDAHIVSFSSPAQLDAVMAACSH